MAKGHPLTDRVRTIMDRFWSWYERHYRINLLITTGLFCLQLVHLYWLLTHVIALKLLGVSYFTPTDFWQTALILVDYTEIPALLSTSLLYIREMRRGKYKKGVVFLILLNSQWLHLFWITDEFVLSQMVLGQEEHATVILPVWLAWVAIFIDYLELPVIIDTVMQVVRSMRSGEFWKEIKKEAKYHPWHI